jgi:hypothetical protein
MEAEFWPNLRPHCDPVKARELPADRLAAINPPGLAA